MAGGFEKFLGKEDHLHRQVIQYIALQYPGVLFHHSPMEGKRTPFEQFKLKWLGAKSGFPDIFIFAANKRGNGLAIELKVKPNRCTENQNAWLAGLYNRNYVAEVCYDFEEAKKVIDNYLKPTP
jgi:hypothetical protein